MLNSPVLVLNKFFFPVDTTSVKRAFLMLYLGAAKAVDMNYETFDFESWSEISSLKKSETIRTVSKTIKIPRVIIVLRYDKVHSKEVKFNRYNIFKRDRSVCQYCKKSFPKNEQHRKPKQMAKTVGWCVEGGWLRGWWWWWVKKGVVLYVRKYVKNRSLNTYWPEVGAIFHSKSDSKWQQKDTGKCPTNDQTNTNKSKERT